MRLASQQSFNSSTVLRSKKVKSWLKIVFPDTSNIQHSYNFHVHKNTIHDSVDCRLQKVIPSSADQRLYLNSSNLRLMLVPLIIDIKDSSPDVNLLACKDFDLRVQ